jgi:hypothetical protein
LIMFEEVNGKNVGDRVYTEIFFSKSPRAQWGKVG